MATATRPRTWVEISAAAVRHNLSAVQRVVGSVPIAPVIKSNAYGHGLAEISRILKSLPIWGVCVAYGEEALRLRQLGWRKPILVLSFWRLAELESLIRQHVSIVAWDMPSLIAALRMAERLRLKTNLHIKIDTGTTRIGFQARELIQVKSRIAQSRYGNCAGIFSHLANSEETSQVRTRKQIKRFTTLDRSLSHLRGVRHLACTAAALRYPEARFGLIRLGIGTYGLWPSDATKLETEPKIALKPVLVWKAAISQIKAIPAGTVVGYGSTWKAKRPSRIATIPIGYGDGYYRSWSNMAWMMVRGHRAPVVGRISMNLVTIDVTNIPGVRRDDVVTVLGPGISSDTLATLGYQTLHYEVTTTIHPAIPRIIV